jgi:hypothetical protein
MKIDGPTTARTVANPNPSGRRKVGVPNKMSSARVERALREGKRLPPENLLLVGADSPWRPFALCNRGPNLLALC